ncbi:1,6-anhydro-N-acetylmuramyl-L-alanine amidase AmpD [Aestuariibacter salexigens]|uniref:1,6-anhydro-N-acetylmuramyl-L-alanine amidase AmpD n=1 Tax=Aestuariibacter salexigens TaxID=226010 RepID=UPI00041F21FD|nr:1,6-anhydro-N-acetylmuramyl-L-alanine amidase AmpD [Aestuariibacter salexigens]
MHVINHRLTDARFLSSPHYSDRPADAQVSLLVLHNISLPPGQFGGDYIDDLFMGQLNKDAHPYFADIHHLRVSAHLLIKRDGAITQYVPFDKAAWHAGLSSFQGQPRCNEYSIGIELEGTDDSGYTNHQYHALLAASRQIVQHYPRTTLGRIVGHSDIAPSRKTDPGVGFDWCRFRQDLTICLHEDQK